MRISEALKERLRAVKLLSLDLDGVMTDGSVYYFDEDGRQASGEMRRFHIRDGMGLKLLMEAGVDVALITLSDAPHIRRRAERLGIKHFYPGVHDKRRAMEKITAELGIGLAQVAHMADDVNDLSLLQTVGVAIAVSGAVPEVKRIAHLETMRDGGNCAVREVCDLLLELKQGA